MVNIKILVIAAHPDDESLGCGGVIARHTQAGDSVHVLILSRGGLAREGTDLNLIKEIADNVEQSMELLGATYNVLNFPDQSFDSVPLLEVIKAIEAEIKKVQPSQVYCHSSADLNEDHKITHKATLTACRPGVSPVKELYCYEVLSTTELGPVAFDPKLFVDITSVLALKVEANMLYCNEMRSYPHPRSKEGVEYLARIRGMQSGLEAAEAFEIIREIKGK